MVGEGDVHISRQVPPQQTLGTLDDLGAHLQVLRGQLHHQLGQALGLAVVLQGVHLLHPGWGHHVPWGFFKADAGSTQHHLVAAAVFGAHEIVADGSDNAVCARLLVFRWNVFHVLTSSEKK